MKQFVESLPGGLDAAVREGGSSMSAGQRLQNLPLNSTSCLFHPFQDPRLVYPLKEALTLVLSLRWLEHFQQSRSVNGHEACQVPSWR